MGGGWNPSKIFVCILWEKWKINMSSKVDVSSGEKGHKQKDTFLQNNVNFEVWVSNRSARKEEVLIIKDRMREWKGKFKKRTTKQVACH